MYKDFLKTPGSIVNVSYLQNAVRTVFKRLTFSAVSLQP